MGWKKFLVSAPSSSNCCFELFLLGPKDMENENGKKMSANGEQDVSSRYSSRSWRKDSPSLRQDRGDCGLSWPRAQKSKSHRQHDAAIYVYNIDNDM